MSIEVFILRFKVVVYNVLVPTERNSNLIISSPFNFTVIHSTHTIPIQDQGRLGACYFIEIMDSSNKTEVHK